MNNKKNVQGILGFGEVGKAVKALLEPKYPVFARDINFDEIANHTINTLHIAIPYTKKFDSVVENILTDLKPQLVVIHSTVKPGTTQKLAEKTKSHVVHTPFMGVHPIKPNGGFVHGDGYDLKDYFTKFPKMIGPTSAKSKKLAVQLFTSLDIEVEVFDSSLETELGKILSTTYYGWNIIFEKWVHTLCDQNKVNFDQVYTRYNQNYNKGYADVLPHVVRPVLKHHDGEIGGHCVIPNTQIINDWLQDEFTTFLLEQNKKLAEK